MRAVRALPAVGARRFRAISHRVITEADEDRLALKLRLGDAWRDRGRKGVAAAHDSLTAEGVQFQPNEAQSAAARELDKLPAALAESRKAFAKWQSQQDRLTQGAETAAGLNARSRISAAARPKAGVFTKAPEAPTAPAVIGPVCWLSLGPPPELNPAGVYLYGSVGTGKSTMMDLFCLYGAEGFRVRRQHFHEFMLWLHQNLHKLGGGQSGGGRQHVLGRIADLAARGTDVLCLDEFAVTNVADAAIFMELLRLLAGRQLALVVTTNRPPEDLYNEGLHRERYIPALVERLRKNFIVTAVQGEDYREKMLRDSPAANGTPVAGGSAPGAMPLFFQGCESKDVLGEAIAGDVEAAPVLAPGTLSVSWGRKLSVEAVGGGFAQFHFNDICRKPISAEDFLYVATSFHTIFVHDIPRLRLDEHNEARRFTNLIDALYEYSVRMICHSEVGLEEVLESVLTLKDANEDTDAAKMGVFEKMYDDTPNFQIQMKELGSADKFHALKDRNRKEEEAVLLRKRRKEVKRFKRMENAESLGKQTGSGWSASPAQADLSSPDQGVAGVMVAAVGSLQESGFAAKRAISRLKEMQTPQYLKAAEGRRAMMAAEA